MWIWWEFIRMGFIRPLKHGHVVSCRNHLDKSELFLEHFSDIRGCQSFVGSRCDSHGCFMGLTTAGCMAVTKQRVFYQRVIGARQRLDWNCRLLQRPLKYEEMLLNLIPCSMCRDIFWCSNDFKKGCVNIGFIFTAIFQKLLERSLGIWALKTDASTCLVFGKSFTAPNRWENCGLSLSVEIFPSHLP